jgi:hypothetical protein
MTEGDPRALATVELLGALTYAQLRAFDVTAAAIRHAPAMRTADRTARFAAREYEAYVILRTRLDELTDLPERAMERQRARVDEFFSGLVIEDWTSACTFFAIGLPIAADFARAIAPALDEVTAEAVMKALAGRDEFAEYAIEQVVEVLAEDTGEARVRMRRFAAEVTGSAFTSFQGAVTDTDALLVLLERLEDTGADDVLRRTAVSLLEQHRRRMLAIGVDTPE